MENREQILNDFYNNTCNEDERLKAKHRNIEFITTTKYVDEYLNKGENLWGKL